MIMTDRERTVCKVWLKVILAWIVITLFIYNVLYIVSPHNVFLVHIMQSLSGRMPVLDMISQHSSTPLPRQVAQLCVILWSFFVILPFLFFILYVDGVYFFCRFIAYERKNIFKNFCFCFLGSLLGIFVLWLLVYMNHIGDGYRSAAVNVLFADSNMSIVITFIYALVGCSSAFAGVNVPLTVIYMFNKQYRDNVDRRLKNG